MERKTAKKNYLNDFLRSENGRLVVYTFLFWGIIIFAFGVFSVLYLSPSYNSNYSVSTGTFASPYDRCVASGGIIEDSYPRTCNMRGKVYSEQLNKLTTSVNETISNVRKTKIETSTSSLVEFQTTPKYKAFQSYYIDNATYKFPSQNGTWVGNKVQASFLPAGWKMEQTRFEDSGTLVNNQNVTNGQSKLFGFAGMTIKDGNGKVIFNMRGITGTINASGCPAIFSFDDSNPLFLETMIGINTTYNGISLTGTIYPTQTQKVGEHTQFSMLKQSMRRAGTTLYKDYMLGDNHFDPRCDSTHEFVNFEGLGSSYEFAQKQVLATRFKLTIASNLSASELSNLDKVLGSLSVLPK